MTARSSRAEALLRAVIGDPARASSILGDLREDFGPSPMRLWRRTTYDLACLAIAMRYAPGVIWDALRVDLRHAARSLARARTFTLTGGLTLTLGFATAATILTVAWGALLRPLPYPEADRLVRWGQSPLTGAGAGTINSAAIANVLDLAGTVPAFDGLAAEQLRGVNVTSDAGAERILAASVTANYFDVLGVRPLAGRTFVAEDDRPGAGALVMIGERLWRRTFGGAPDIVGKTVRLDATPHLVIGVVPASVALPGDPQAWRPFQWDAAARAVRRSRNVEPIGRLRAGVSIAAGTDALQAAFAALARQHPDENGRSTVAVMAYRDWLLGRTGPNRALLPLIAAAAAVLLVIAFLNVANLAVGRAEGRRHEHALRQALGASAWRQFVQRLSEALLIVVPAAAGGTLLAFWAVPLVVTRYADAIPRAATIAPGLATVVIVLAAAIAGAAVIAAGAGRGVRRVAGAAALNQRTTTAALRQRRRLVAVQIGLASGLVYGAVLLGATIASLARVDLGVPLDRALTFVVGLPPDRYREPADVRRYFDDLTARLRRLPQVTAAGATSRAPFAGGTNGEVTAADDPSRAAPLAEWRVVTPDLFDALGLAIVDGRGFDSLPPEAGRVAVVSEALGRALFGDQTAVGRGVLAGPGAPYQVVGVVRDLRDFGPTRPSRPTLYLRHATDAGFASASTMTFVVRTSGAATAIVPDVRHLVRDLDPDVPLQRVATLADLATRSFGTSRTTAATIVIGLAGVALALGAIGVFGVVAFGVEQRTREFGVRIAIGDTPGGIVRLVMGDGLRLTAAGLLVGGIVAWFVDGLVGAFVVPALAPGEAVSAVLSVALLAATTLVACALPARRAARLSPTDALRDG